MVAPGRHRGVCALRVRCRPIARQPFKSDNRYSPKPPTVRALPKKVLTPDRPDLDRSKGSLYWAHGEVELKLIDVNKDLEVCAPGGQKPRENDLHIDNASRGIADVVVFAQDQAETRKRHETGGI